MKYRGKKNTASHALYPNNVNAAGVPLVGQTGAQAIKNFDRILQSFSLEQRLAFELARSQAYEEVELEKQVGE